MPPSSLILAAYLVRGVSAVLPSALGGVLEVTAASAAVAPPAGKSKKVVKDENEDEDEDEDEGE